MQLSKKSEYAVRAVIILASQGMDRPMQTGDMANQGKIPRKFLEQILLTLKNGGIITSKRGVGGGYRIARESRKITVLQVVHCIEGELPALPGDDHEFDFVGSEGLVDCFTKAIDSYKAVLEKNTIEDLINHGNDNMVGYNI